jgi:predicted PurR-regulated permease PerM
MKNSFVGMRLSYFLLAIILLIYALIMGKEFLYPISFGMLISYLLYPIVNFLEKKGFPRIISILIPILIAIAVFVFIAFMVLQRINLFMDDMPYFRNKTVDHIVAIQKYIENEFGIPGERFKNFLLASIYNIGTQSGKVFTTTTGTLFILFMQPVYVFLFLYYRTKFAYFILKIVGRENRMIAIEVLREIATVVTRYMLGVTTVVLILCIFNSVGLLIIGIKYPVLLGVISALFSFIPYFGNFIGGLVPLLFSLLTEDSLGRTFRILIFVYIIHFFENNILSPNIVGNNIRLNPFVIILGLIIGAMIWGIPGMLVTIPLLAILKIILKRIPDMQPYSYLLGTRGTKRHALTGQNIRRYLDVLKVKIIRNRKNGPVG